MDIDVQPVWEDNYQYLVFGDSGALAVDPADAEPVRAALKKCGVQLAGILITHHHADHIAGVPDLAREFTCPVTGPRDAALAMVTRPVGEGDALEMAGLQIAVLSTPGHTATHVSYHLPAAAVAFVGDVLFTMGCGRVAPGLEPALLYASIRKLCALGDAVQLYSGHEYAQENARFALTIEPQNRDIIVRAAKIAEMRSRGLPTVPSTIAEERRTNVFVRAPDPQSFVRLRARKNVFA